VIRGREAAVLGIALILAAGCSELKKNRCDHDWDCDQTMQMCDPAAKRCVPKDAGAGGVGGGGEGGAGGLAGHDAGVDKTPSCLLNASICTDPNQPFCDDHSGLCRACIEDMECRKLDATKPVCETHGDGPGVCVQCGGAGDCSSERPVCNLASHACEPCKLDSDCSLFPPNVCKTKLASAADAAPPAPRCARPDETIYVGKPPGGACSDTPGAGDAGAGDAGAPGPGSLSLPFCSMQPALGAIMTTRNVIVVTGSVAAGTWTYADQAKGPLLIVGQNKAKIISSSNPGFSMSSGTVTIRSLTFTSQLTTGIEASGGTITLDHVTVDQCVGGGVLFDGASFDVENSAITRNGTVMDGLVSWSGIYVKTMKTGGTYKLNQVTIAGNDNAGLLCAGPIAGTGVLAYGNGGGVQIATACNVNSCGMSDAGASMTCGAQM
jgi:hypothetical protein